MAPAKYSLNTHLKFLKDHIRILKDFKKRISKKRFLEDVGFHLW